MAAGRRLLFGFSSLTLLYVISVVFNDVPRTPTPSMTFGWKSRVRLQGHVETRDLEKRKLEEVEQLQEQLLAEAGLTEAGALRRSPGAQGLLAIWRKNQLRILAELQKLIKDEVGPDAAPLISLIRRSLVPPSIGPLKTSHGVRMTNLADTVDRLIGPSTKGFFVEANAYDGEGSSHTLWLEKVRGWTGVLVEPDPAYYLQVLGKNRRAWSLNAALSPSRVPAQIVTEDGEHQLGAIGGATSGGRRTLVPAYPLHSLLLALNQTRIDFLCLDVGGEEWTILQTIPWDDITVTVIAIGVSRSPVEASHFVDLLTNHGYRCYNKPETQDNRYVTSGTYVVCNQHYPDIYIYQDENTDFD